MADLLLSPPSSLGMIPPHNIEAEEAVLGSILIDQDAIIKIADHLNPEDFYAEKHRILYEAMQFLYSNREPIDVLSLSNRLEQQQALTQIGGRAYLAVLTNMVPTASNVDHYAKIVQRKATLRRLIKSGHEIVKFGQTEEDDLEKLLDKAEQTLFSVSQQYLKQNFVALHSILTDAFNRLDEIHRNEGKLRGTATGFTGLDNMLGGLQKSDLVILAARPSMGKTGLVLDIARHVAVREKIPTAIVSLEMSKDQLGDRLLCGEAGVDLWKMRTGKLQSNDDFASIGRAMGALAEAPLFIDDSASANIMEIRTKARRLQMEHGIGLLIVDYLQLMEGRNTENRVQEIAEISRGLKSIARELNIPVLALSQLSRAVEMSNPPIPKLSHLRESGCLSADTRVYNAETEELIEIERIAKEQLSFETLTINAELKLERKRLKKAFSSGVKRLYQLTLASGKCIKASANHPFLTRGGWKRLDSLRAAMEIMTVPGNKQQVSEKISAIWDAVVSIEALGEALVYDAEVEDNHNFLANDIIVHNSIEQDADVVMFIYREEYYKRDTDRKNIADIFIAKHRNGPTGQIELFFDIEKASFKNLEKRLNRIGPPPPAAF